MGKPAGKLSLRRHLVVTVAGALIVVLGAPAVRAATASAPAPPPGPVLAPNPSWADTPQWTQTLADEGGPVAESSPIVATLDGDGPSVVVGDRSGDVYAFHLGDGSAVPGWPVATGSPVDSTPSVTPLTAGSPLDSIFVGAGNAASPVKGGYRGIAPSGTTLWHTSVTNPTADEEPDGGVEASLSLGTLQSGPNLFAGSLGQEAYALSAASGSTLTGWPFFDSDSTFSTAAIADLYGTGHNEAIVGGDQTAGEALGQTYTQGGHLRIFNSSGGLICHADTQQVVDSSPAVGGFLTGGATGIAVGTGSYFTDAPDSDVVKAFNTTCGTQWTAQLDGSTFSSPALADITGTGALDVVEGTDTGSSGSVYALDGTTGKILWQVPAIDRVIGSITAADLFGNGYQDLLVPTIKGVEVLDGRTGAEVAALNANSTDGILGFQNSPLVTDDPGGSVGITVAGYNGDDQTVVEHFEVPDSDGSLVDEAGSWPMFHHDPQLTGDAGDTTPLGGQAPCAIPSAAQSGYDLVASDGGIFSYGGQSFCGSTGNIKLAQPVVGIAQAPGTGGYWMVGADGGVFAYGGAGYYGSMGGQPLAKPVVGIAATPDGRGYWLVAADGGIFAFGDARFLGSTGSIKLAQPIVGMAANADGLGYRLVAADGGIFAYGDSGFLGSTGNIKLAQPIVGMADDIATGGYWMVAADGGIFAFDAPYDGSMGEKPLAQPIVGMQATLSGDGYRLVAADGGIFSFGAAAFDGSTGGLQLARPIVGMTGP
jgi:hypothetical protein